MGNTQARRAWLNRYRQAIKRENALCARIEQAEAPPVEWREQLALQVVQGLDIRREIERAIEALPDAMQVCVLRYRYLACMTTKQTAPGTGLYCCADKPNTGCWAGRTGGAGGAGMNEPNRERSEKNTAAAGQQEANAALAALAATGNTFALGQLWEINKGLLRSLFWRWYPSHKALADAHGLTADDFEQEGYFAVQYAAEHYDPGKGFAFSTWLAYAMQRQIDRALTGGHRRNVTDADGKQHTVSADPLNHCTSLDVPLDDEDGGAATLGDLQPAPAAAGELLDVEERLYQEQLHAALEEALYKLTEREQAVIRGNFYAGKSVRQISEEQGLTIGQANTAKANAFRKLRRNPRLMRWREESIRTHAWRGTGFTAWAHGGSVEERTVEYLESRGAYIGEENPAGEVMPNQE